MAAHVDKGGNGELSALINRAADELMSRHPDEILRRLQRQMQEEHEEEQQTAAKRARDEEERTRRYAEEGRVAKNRHLREALQRTSARGASARQKAYLSPSTKCVFPRLAMRIFNLQEKRNWQKGKVPGLRGGG